MKKRIISIALVAVMIVAMIPAMLLPTWAALGHDGGYDAPIVNKGAITIDANETPDAAYANAEMIQSVTTGDFYGFTAADEDGFYLWFNIKDSTNDKQKGYPDPNEFDNPEAPGIVKGVNGGDYFQTYFKAATATAYNITSLSFDYVNGGRVMSENGMKGKMNASMVDVAATVIDGGWILEAYVPFEAFESTPGVHPDYFGNYNEETGSYERKAEDFTGVKLDDINIWAAFQYTDRSNTTKEDTSYGNKYSYVKSTFYRGCNYLHSAEAGDANGGYFGSFFTRINFSGIDTVVTTDSIVLDGKLDDSYNKSELIESDRAWGVNSSFKARTVATLQGYYIYVDICDNTLNKPEFANMGHGDKLQVYFQMGAAFSYRNWGYVEIDYREARYEASDYDGDTLKVDAVAKPAISFTNKSPVSWTITPEVVTTKNYDEKGNATGWSAELFLPWSGDIELNNISDLSGITFSMNIQVNDSQIVDGKNTPSTYVAADASWKNTVGSYNNRLGSRSYYAWNNTSGFGNSFFTPVVFDFEQDTPDLIKNWALKVDSVTLDADKDAVYDNATKKTVTQAWKHATKPALASLAESYYVYTDDAVYVYVDVTDTTGYQGGHANEYVSIYITNSNTVSKFQIYSNGKFGTNTNFEGSMSYSLVSEDLNGNIAFKYKGTPGNDDYTGYCVEYKIDLTPAEKHDMANGKSVSIGIGVEINDAGITTGTNVERTYYGYSSPTGGHWWVGMTYNIDYQWGTRGGTSVIPKFLLCDDIAASNFAVNPSVTGVNVSLGKSIDLNLYVNLPLNATDAQIKVTFNEKEYYLNAKKTNTANEYKFTFENVAPQCLGDVIVADLIVNGQTISLKKEADKFTVANYLNGIKGAESGKYDDVIDALLLYGAAAQKYTNYKADALVADVADIADPDFTGAVKNVTAASAGAKIVAAGVRHANINKLYVKVATDDIENVEALTVKIGEAAPVALELVECEEGVYIAYTDGIKATDFGTECVFTLEYASGDADQVFTYNVYGYTKAIAENSSSANSKLLVKALYNYGAAAAELN